MSQHIDSSDKLLAVLGEMFRRRAKGGLTDNKIVNAIQALLEDKPPGESSRDQRIVEWFEGFGFTEANFDERLVYESLDGQRVTLKRHRNGGGWVPVNQDQSDPNKAYVADEVYVGPTVKVVGRARLNGGRFHGGEFHGGVFHDGRFYDGEFRGGVFYSGVFFDGVFRGGEFRDGEFRGGKFYSGVFSTGLFLSGNFRGGEFTQFAALYKTHGKDYSSHKDADNADQLHWR